MISIHGLLPPLRIHSWGGFGSQLFTAFLIIKVQKLYPARRINVIVHTSGVTRRSTEFNFNSLGVATVERDDFQANSKDINPHVHRSTHSLSQKLRLAGKKLLLMLHFIEISNDDSLLSLIKPWTLSIRGHYTRITLDLQTVTQLYTLLNNHKSDDSLIQYSLALHYRLGDLLHLKQKAPIETKRVEEIATKYTHLLKDSILLTDSTPSESQLYVQDEQILRLFKVDSLPPNMTLITCVMANTFIGTSAKISIWAAIFRQYIFFKRSYLPDELSWVKEIGLDCNWF